jgi:ABC-2 type transport system ATP-binding protein
MSEPTRTAATATAASCAGDALVVDGLSGGYDAGDVFRDVRLVVPAGESVRVAGPNAAGKSTLVRCVAGIKHPRTGRVSICRHDLAAEPVAAKRHLGYSAGAGPFTYLTGREHLRLAARVHCLRRDNETHILDRFACWPVVRGIDDEVRRYSHGMRQQLSLLLAVIHDPCLLVLDEAVDGLDDDVLADWSTYLRERARSGRSLLFVEHRDEVAAGFPPAHRLQLSSSPTTTTQEAANGTRA